MNIKENKEPLSDDPEVEFNSSMAEKWWNKRTLIALNEVRVPFVCNGCYDAKYIKKTAKDGPYALEGLNFLDVGCGGGILSEALARLRAHVVGVDPSGPLIAIARIHAGLDKQLDGYLRYEQNTMEEFCETNALKFDVVVLSEVIEHVTNQEKLLESCVKCLKFGGSLFITAPNRTRVSQLCTITLAETLGTIPAGTHDYDKFISLADLITSLKKLGCSVRKSEGILMNPWTGKFKMSSSKLMMYALHAQKTK